MNPFFVCCRHDGVFVLATENGHGDDDVVENGRRNVNEILILLFDLMVNGYRSEGVLVSGYENEYVLMNEYVLGFVIFCFDLDL